MPFTVYIIYSSLFDKYYVGQTNDLEKRINRHNKGIEKFTAPFRPWVLKCLIIKNTRGEAMLLERKLKNMNREKLVQFIAKYS